MNSVCVKPYLFDTVNEVTQTMPTKILYHSARSVPSLQPQVQWLTLNDFWIFFPLIIYPSIYILFIYYLYGMERRLTDKAHSSHPFTAKTGKRDIYSVTRGSDLHHRQTSNNPILFVGQMQVARSIGRCHRKRNIPEPHPERRMAPGSVDQPGLTVACTTLQPFPKHCPGAHCHLNSTNTVCLAMTPPMPRMFVIGPQPTAPGAKPRWGRSSSSYSDAISAPISSKNERSTAKSSNDDTVATIYHQRTMFNEQCSSNL